MALPVTRPSPAPPSLSCRSMRVLRLRGPGLPGPPLSAYLPPAAAAAEKTAIVVAQQLVAPAVVGDTSGGPVYVGDCRAALLFLSSEASSPRLRHGRRFASGYLRDTASAAVPLAFGRWVTAHAASGLSAASPDVALNVLADLHAAAVARASALLAGVAAAAARAFDAALSDARCLARPASLFPLEGARLPRAAGSLPARRRAASCRSGAPHSWHLACCRLLVLPFTCLRLAFSVLHL